MRRKATVILSGVLCLATTMALGGSASQLAAIDPVTVSAEKYQVLLDNPHVRVVEYTIAPGEKDQWHTHPAKVSYVVTGGTLRITMDDGRSFVADEKAGEASWMDPLPKHFAENIGKSTVKIVLVEVKAGLGH